MAFRSDEPRDDIDRLFARLEKVDPPPDLAQRVMRSLPTHAPASPQLAPQRVAPQQQRGWSQWPHHQWAAAIAGVLFVVMSVWLGSALNDSGSLSLLGDAFGDTGTFWS